LRQGDAEAAKMLVEFLRDDLNRLATDVKPLLDKAGREDLFKKLQGQRDTLHKQVTRIDGVMGDAIVQQIAEVTVKEVAEAVWQQYDEVAKIKREVHVLCRIDPATTKASAFLDKALKQAAENAEGSNYYAKAQNLLLKAFRYELEHKCGLMVWDDFKRSLEHFYAGWSPSAKDSTKEAGNHYWGFQYHLLGYLAKEEIEYPFVPQSAQEKMDCRTRLAFFWKPARDELRQAIGQGTKPGWLEDCVKGVDRALDNTAETLPGRVRPDKKAPPFALLGGVLSDDLAQFRAEAAWFLRMKMPHGEGQSESVQKQIDELEGKLKKKGNLKDLHKQVEEFDDLKKKADKLTALWSKWKALSPQWQKADSGLRRIENQRQSLWMKFQKDIIRANSSLKGLEKIPNSEAAKIEWKKDLDNKKREQTKANDDFVSKYKKEKEHLESARKKLDEELKIVRISWEDLDPECPSVKEQLAKLEADRSKIWNPHQMKIDVKKRLLKEEEKKNGPPATREILKKELQALESEQKKANDNFLIKNKKDIEQLQSVYARVLGELQGYPIKGTGNLQATQNKMRALEPLKKELDRLEELKSKRDGLEAFQKTREELESRAKQMDNLLKQIVACAADQDDPRTREQVILACTKMIDLVKACPGRNLYAEAAALAAKPVTEQEAVRQFLMTLWSRARDPELLKQKPHLLLAIHQFLWSFLRFEREIRAARDKEGEEERYMRDAFGTFALDFPSHALPHESYLISLVGKPEMAAITETIVDYFAQRATVTEEDAGKAESRRALFRLVRELYKKDLAKLERTPQGEIAVNTALSNLEGMLRR
jgi:uncharacterized protein YukE